MRNKITPPYGLKAFTLSEVLITLVIIGVVAAFTIPSLIQNHKRQEATDRLLKFYSTVNQVILKAKADGNDWEYWAETASNSTDMTSATTSEFAENYILPYIVYHKVKTNSQSVNIYLNDGSNIYLFKGRCLDFVFDINGDKKPNVYGRDIFDFLYCPKSVIGRKTEKIIPYLTGVTSREQALELCKRSGITCSTLLLFDDWVFKEDYPYHI